MLLERGCKIRLFKMLHIIIDVGSQKQPEMEVMKHQNRILKQPKRQVEVESDWNDSEDDFEAMLGTFAEAKTCILLRQGCKKQHFDMLHFGTVPGPTGCVTGGVTGCVLELVGSFLEPANAILY